MKITVRCAMFDGGKPCGRKLGAITWDTWPGILWAHGGTDYDGRLEDEWHFRCRKHNATRIYKDDLTRAIKAGEHVIMATSAVRG